MSSNEYNMNKRKRIDTLALCPIVYGSIATPLVGKKTTDENATHRWTLYGMCQVYLLYCVNVCIFAFYI